MDVSIIGKIVLENGEEYTTKEIIEDVGYYDLYVHDEYVTTVTEMFGTEIFYPSHYEFLEAGVDNKEEFNTMRVYY